MDPLGDQLRHEGFGAPRVAAITEAGRESGYQAQVPVDVAQSTPTSLRGEVTGIESALTAAHGVK